MQSRSINAKTLVHPFQSDEAKKNLNDLLSKKIQSLPIEVSAPENTPENPQQKSANTRPWLLRDSDKGLGFITFVTLKKTLNEENQVIKKIINVRFYFHYNFESKQFRWDDKYITTAKITKKHAEMKAIKDDPAKYATYMEAINNQVAVDALFLKIHSMGYQDQYNLPYLFEIKASEYYDTESLPLYANLTRQLSGKPTEVNPTDVSSTLFHQPAEEAPARSHTPDPNPPKQGYSPQ